MLLNITGEALNRYPELRVFIETFPSQYIIATDTNILDAPDDDPTMVIVWKKLSSREKQNLCNYINNKGFSNKIHPGILALMPIRKVIHLLTHRGAFPNLSEIVTTTLRNRTKELVDNLSKSNALLDRLINVKRK